MVIFLRGGEHTFFCRGKQLITFTISCIRMDVCIAPIKTSDFRRQSSQIEIDGQQSIENQYNHIILSGVFKL